jgi:hypothetical protein
MFNKLIYIRIRDANNNKDVNIVIGFIGTEMPNYHLLKGILRSMKNNPKSKFVFAGSKYDDKSNKLGLDTYKADFSKIVNTMLPESDKKLFLDKINSGEFEIVDAMDKFDSVAEDAPAFANPEDNSVDNSSEELFKTIKKDMIRRMQEKNKIAFAWDLMKPALQYCYPQALIADASVELKENVNENFNKYLSSTRDHKKNAIEKVRADHPDEINDKVSDDALTEYLDLQNGVCYSLCEGKTHTSLTYWKDITIYKLINGYDEYYYKTDDSGTKTKNEESKMHACNNYLYEGCSLTTNDYVKQIYRLNSWTNDNKNNADVIANEEISNNPEKESNNMFTKSDRLLAAYKMGASDGDVRLNHLENGLKELAQKKNKNGEAYQKLPSSKPIGILNSKKADEPKQAALRGAFNSIKSYLPKKPEVKSEIKKHQMGIDKDSQLTIESTPVARLSKKANTITNKDEDVKLLGRIFNSVKKEKTENAKQAMLTEQQIELYDDLIYKWATKKEYFGKSGYENGHKAFMRNSEYVIELEKIDKQHNKFAKYSFLMQNKMASFNNRTTYLDTVKGREYSKKGKVRYFRTILAERVWRELSNKKLVS